MRNDPLLFLLALPFAIVLGARLGIWAYRVWRAPQYERFGWTPPAVWPDQAPSKYDPEILKEREAWGVWDWLALAFGCALALYLSYGAYVR